MPLPWGSAIRLVLRGEESHVLARTNRMRVGFISVAIVPRRRVQLAGAEYHHSLENEPSSSRHTAVRNDLMCPASSSSRSITV